MKNQLYDPHVLHITPSGSYAGSWGSKFAKINHVPLTVNQKMSDASVARINTLIASGEVTVKIDGKGTTSITRKYPWENGEWDTIE